MWGLGKSIIRKVTRETDENEEQCEYGERGSPTSEFQRARELEKKERGLWSFLL